MTVCTVEWCNTYTRNSPLPQGGRKGKGGGEWGWQASQASLADIKDITLQVTVLGYRDLNTLPFVCKVSEKPET